MVRYPLQQVLVVKKDRVDKAHKVVLQKEEALRAEETKLKSVEAERDKTLHHHQDKLTQLRSALDEGAPSGKIIEMKHYLKLVKEQLHEKEKKVTDQKHKVNDARRALEHAKTEWKKRRLEEEKMLLHKEEWEKEARKEVARQEENEENELGSILHQAKHKKKKGET